MTEYSFENELISDLHKDARNHRPTSGFMAMWNDLNDDQKQECWDNLISEMKLSQEQSDSEEVRHLLSSRQILPRLCKPL